MVLTKSSQSPGLLYLTLLSFHLLLPSFPFFHHFSHLRLTPPHSLQCLHSDSYVLEVRGLLLICAEWEKAVLAWGERKPVWATWWDGWTGKTSKPKYFKILPAVTCFCGRKRSDQIHAEVHKRLRGADYCSSPSSSSCASFSHPL